MEGQRTIKTVILCAGHATRLYPFSDLIPKPMMPVGGKPVLRHIINRLSSYNFKDIVLCVNRKDYPLFLDYFGAGDRFGVNIDYSLSEKPLGTVGEVLNAKDHITDSFLLYYGDELAKIKLDELKETHEKTIVSGGICTLALIQTVPLEVGIVEWIPEDGVGPKIVNFKEKPPLNKTVWAGIAMMQPDTLNYTQKGDDFGADLFPRLLNKEIKLYGYLSNSEWYDMGTLSHYRKVCKLAEEGKL